MTSSFSLSSSVWDTVVALLVVVAAPLLAQSEFPRAQVFGGYSYFNLDTSGLTGRENFNGWNAQSTFNLNHWLGVTADFGGYYGNVSGVGLHDYTYLFPGLQKVVQAAGRVIRTTTDEGVVFLIDDRFRRAEVRRLLPAWWHVDVA